MSEHRLAIREPVLGTFGKVHLSRRRRIGTGGRLGGLGIRGRLVVLVLALAALSLACVGVAVSGLLSARSKSQQAAATFRVFEADRDAYEGWLSDDDQSNMYVALAALNDPGQRQQMAAEWQQVPQGYQQARVNLITVRSRVSSAAIRAAAASGLADLAAYNVFTQRVHADVLAGEVSLAVHVMAVDNTAISNKTQADFNHIGQALSAQASAINAAVSHQVSQSLTLVAVIGFVAIVIAVLISIWLVRSITRPLAEVTRAAERIALGDVDVDVKVRSDDEIGRMAAAFRSSVGYLREMVHAAREIAAGNLAVEVKPKSEHDALGHAFAEMRANIANMVSQIWQTSQTVSAASQQMAATSEETGRATGEIAHAVGDVAQGAERQVQMVEAARNAAEAVARAVSESAQNAAQAAQMAHETSKVAHEGVDAAAQANEAMNSVTQSSQAVSNAIRELAAKSDQIDAILATITAIAEQTNLLALNAAIEAARAGEQGRGFAVVAEEVRKLAEQSQQSAHEISVLITAIQNDTTNAVNVVADGAKRTHDGAAVVQRTREAFQRIESSVDDMTAQIEQIAAASQQIAASAAGMQQSVAEVAAVAEQSSASTEEVSASTEQTSASAQEIAASAQQLSGDAEELSRLVAQFRTAA
ncbi:MAG: methyl-accepting chemotaxis protein [Solirubrobacteraceae bacterium]